MIDVSLAFDAERFEFDVVLERSEPETMLSGDTMASLRQEAGANQVYSDLQGDTGLLTAIIISLFTDRRANADDPLPDERVGVLSDRRGWWGDHILEEDAQDPIGSRLWLLSREKEMEVVLVRARQYAEEAVTWLVRDRHVRAVKANAHHVGPGHLGISVQALPLSETDEQTREWNFIYDYVNATPLTIESPGAF